MKLTDLLDLVGLLLLVAAAAVLVGRWSFAGAIGVAGVGLLGVSALIDARRTAVQRAGGDR